MNVQELYQWMLDNPDKGVSSNNKYQGASLEAIKNNPHLFEPGGARGSWKPANKIKHKGEWIDKPYNPWFPTGKFMGKQVPEGVQDVVSTVSEIAALSPGRVGGYITKPKMQKLTTADKKIIDNIVDKNQKSIKRIKGISILSINETVYIRKSSRWKKYIRTCC